MSKVQSYHIYYVGAIILLLQCSWFVQFKHFSKLFSTKALLVFPCLVGCDERPQGHSAVVRWRWTYCGFNHSQYRCCGTNLRWRHTQDFQTRCYSSGKEMYYILPKTLWLLNSFLACDSLYRSSINKFIQLMNEERWETAEGSTWTACVFHKYVNIIKYRFIVLWCNRKHYRKSWQSKGINSKCVFPALKEKDHYVLNSNLINASKPKYIVVA